MVMARARTSKEEAVVERREGGSVARGKGRSREPHKRVVFGLWACLTSFALRGLEALYC